MTTEAEELWREYAENPNPRLRQELALLYSGLVYKIASSFLYKKPSIFDFDDIIQDGTLGLLDAIDKFDPNRGVKFSTYAQLRIKGSIIDGINVMDWTPRRIKKEIRDVLRSIEKHGETNYEKIGEELGIKPEEVKSIILKMSKTYIVPMDFEAIIFHSPATDIEKDESIKTVKHAMETCLTPDEQEVVRMSYLEGYPNTEIARQTSYNLKEIKDLKDSGLAKLKEELSYYFDNKDN
jgi:RNA polymerase sigma factor for flagellar operon FliA